MPEPESPVVAGWELALRLRERRAELRIDVQTVTEKLGCSRNYWSAVEHERKILTEESLLKVLDLFRYSRDERKELLRLRLAAKEHGWWTRYSDVVDHGLQRLVGLEWGAHKVQTWENILVPGLLQTSDYAQALMTPDVNVRQVDVEQHVEARMHRQQRLTGSDPLRMTALISEAVLRQEIGGRRVLRRQLEHIAAMAKLLPETIEIRVIPFSASACGLFGAATVYLMDFQNPRLPTVAWHETVTSWGIVDDPAKVRAISGTYGEALGRALSDRQSLKMINDRIRELA